MNGRQPNSPEHKDFSGWQSHKTRLQWLMLPSTQRIGKGTPHPEQALSCSLGLLRVHCEDRRSPLWATRDGPQHEHSRSDTIMISMNFNSRAVCIFHNSSFVQLCFWTRNFLYYMGASCVWFLLPYVRLQSYWAGNLQNVDFPPRFS